MTRCSCPSRDPARISRFAELRATRAPRPRQPGLGRGITPGLTLNGRPQNSRVPVMPPRLARFPRRTSRSRGRGRSRPHHRPSSCSELQAVSPSACDEQLALEARLGTPTLEKRFIASISWRCAAGSGSPDQGLIAHCFSAASSARAPEAPPCAGDAGTDLQRFERLDQPASTTRRMNHFVAGTTYQAAARRCAMASS